ncbi:MAG: Gfo/Idh/MocA family oxidoreductase [Ruminiclostridium sp.]|nr:Gfo/Idh/MocA family oxidoreductase [Ruminiclostridium sp.]
MKKINAAIIGCGSIFPVHADAIKGLEQVQLRVVCDIVEEKARLAAQKYDCSYTTDYIDILKNPDIQAVHLCTPHFLHAPMAKELMQAGKHVLTEKPMGLNLNECNELIEISRATGCSLGVCMQNRYHTTSLVMKELIESGRMGGVLGARAFVTWERTRDYYQKSPWRGTWAKEGGSLLMNQAIHTLDLLVWLLGDVEAIKGTIANHSFSEIIETEDTTEAIMQFRSGARALFYASNAYVSNAPVYLEVICEQGSMVQNGELTVSWKDGNTEVFEDVPPTEHKTYWGTGHKNLIRDFHDCLARGVPFPANGIEGAKAISIIEKLYQKHLVSR